NRKSWDCLDSSIPEGTSIVPTVYFPNVSVTVQLLDGVSRSDFSAFSFGSPGTSTLNFPSGENSRNLSTGRSLVQRNQGPKPSTRHTPARTIIVPPLQAWRAR